MSVGNIINGYILAKALRIANISQPDNLESFGLEETINVDDVITSFIFKAYLLDKDGHTADFVSRYYKMGRNVSLYELHPVVVAKLIYEQLRFDLIKKEIISSHTKEWPVDCRVCEHEYGCCKQRKLMLAMVEKILDWLNELADELQGIDYRNNVDLARIARPNFFTSKYFFLLIAFYILMAFFILFSIYHDLWGLCHN